MYLATLFASLLIYLAVSLSFINSRYFSAFHPLTLYLVFHGIVFVFRPFLSEWLNYEMIYRLYEFTPSISDKITVIAAANLGLLAFSFFVLRHGAVEMRFRRTALLLDERNRLARYFLWVLVVCVPIAALSLRSNYLAAATNSIYDNLATDRTTGVIYNTTSNGYFYEAQMMLVSMVPITAWLFRFRLVAMIPLLLFVVSRSATGGRGPFVTALIATGLFWLFEQRRKLPTPRIMAGAAAVLMLFTAIGADRGQAVRDLIGGDNEAEFVGREDLHFMEGMDFANLEFFQFIVYVVPQRSHTYGYFNDVLQLFTEPIPRSLWKSKPFGAPFERIRLYDYGFPVGYTRSLPGEGWYALGWVGVIIWCGLWGYCLGLVYRRFVQSEQNAFQVAAFMVFLPIMVIAYRDGTVVTVFRQGIFIFTPVLLWIGLTKYFNVPLARQIEAMLIRRQRRLELQGENPPEGSVPQFSPGDSWKHLPAAVRRRRLALHDLSGPNAAPKPESSQ